DFRIPHIDPVQTIVIGRGHKAVHPLIAVFSKVPVVQAQKLLLRPTLAIRSSVFVGNTGHIPALIPLGIIVEQTGNRSSGTPSGLARVLVYTSVPNPKATGHPATALSKGTFPTGFV